MKYIIIDAVLIGTGIRDEYEGGYISPESLGISLVIRKRLKEWLAKYANEHFSGYSNEILIDELDNEGIEIASRIEDELIDVKVSYYSDARLKKIQI